MFKPLEFRPLPGLASPHLQMLFACYTPAGDEPPSQPLYITLSDGDRLCCQLSTPETWQPHNGTIALLHGLGGSHTSTYMIRLSRKFYELGKRVIRINLRGCGSGLGLNKKTYMGGNSADIISVLQLLKMEAPLSPIHLIGFSLGGNIILKMAGELGEKASSLLTKMSAICPSLDLGQNLKSLLHPSNRLYHRYYLSLMIKQGKQWVGNRHIGSIQEFDEQITAPLWGFSSIHDYYEKCSSLKYIPLIRIPCDLLFAADDPFIDYKTLLSVKLSETSSAHLTQNGSHMGFIGRTSQKGGIFWMDQLLLDWAAKDSV
jgi:predicted alpha/beta-fold hydrolase